MLRFGGLTIEQSRLLVFRFQGPGKSGLKSFGQDITTLLRVP